jgi:hypothetical protein
MAEKFTLDSLLNEYQSRTKLFMTDNNFIDNTQFDAMVVDQVDGKIVLQNRLSLTTDEGAVAFSRLKGEEQVDIQVTQGKAIIQTDPYNGDTLITPKGDVTVRVRPVLETSFKGNPIKIAGDEYEVGIDIANVPTQERDFRNAAGGGACASQFRLGPEDEYAFELRVRAYMPASVIPLSLDRRRINWNYSLYFAHDPMMGLMRIRNNPAIQSQTNLKSLSAGKKGYENDFFPAGGRNDLYFVIEMLDMGLSCFNKKPMVQSYQHTEWPPYSTVLTIDEPVEFFSTEKPDQLMMTISKNDMQIYDYTSIDVECTDFKISEDGILHSRWKFSNQSSEKVMARWFALGNFEKDGGFPDQGSRLLGPAKSGLDEFEVNFTAQLEKSSLSQFITMNIVSLNEPVLMGSKRVDFHFPENQG